MPQRYPLGFRRRVLELLTPGRGVTEVAEETGIGSRSIDNSRRRPRRR